MKRIFLISLIILLLFSCGCTWFSTGADKVFEKAGMADRKLEKFLLFKAIDEPCEENLKHRQGAIEELMVDLEAYRYYLNYLNSVVVPIRNTSNGNIYYKTKCYNDGSLVRQICTGERCGSHPYD